MPVDDPRVADVVLLAGDPGDEAALPQPLARRIEVDLAGREQLLGEHAAVVGADLGGGGALVQPAFRSALLEPAGAQARGGHAVEG